MRSRSLRNEDDEDREEDVPTNAKPAPEGHDFLVALFARELRADEGKDNGGKHCDQGNDRGTDHRAKNDGEKQSGNNGLGTHRLGQFIRAGRDDIVTEFLVAFQ